MPQSMRPIGTMSRRTRTSAKRQRRPAMVLRLPTKACCFVIGSSMVVFQAQSLVRGKLMVCTLSTWYGGRQPFLLYDSVLHRMSWPTSRKTCTPSPRTVVNPRLRCRSDGRSVRNRGLLRQTHYINVSVGGGYFIGRSSPAP